MNNQNTEIRNNLILGLSAFSIGVILAPYLKNVLKKSKKNEIKKIRMIDLVGNTPLIYLKSLSELCGCQIYAKAEFMNPSGSMKDRTALSIIKGGIKRQILSVENPWIYEGTSGSTGISLSALGLSMGFRTKLFLNDDLAQEKYDQLELLQAELVKVRPVSIVDKNNFCKLAQEAALKDNAFYADQFHNMDNMQTHYDETAEEIWAQTNGLVECFVMSAGTGGTIAGVSKKLKERNPKVKIILADPPGSSLKNKVKHNVCYSSVEAEGHRLKNPFDTIIEGVGQNRVTDNFASALIDDAFTVKDQESLHMALFLIQNEGFCVGASSALNCVAAVKTARKYPQLTNIVTVLCDSGTRYMSKFYSPNYLSKHDIIFQPKENYRGKNYNLDFVE